MSTEVFYCVRPKGEELTSCGRPATLQSRANVSGSYLQYCAEDAANLTDEVWLPIDSDEAIFARLNWAERLAEGARMKAEQEAWIAANPELMELAEGVYEYAKKHYNDGGWDVLVECWELVEIAGSLANDDPVPSTVEVAIDSFRDAVSVWDDRQRDAKNSAF